MAKINDKIAELKEIKALVKKWPARLKAYAKATGKSEASFCADHGLNAPRFNEWKNGVTDPRRSTVDKVEAAFLAEGV